ncbi:MAG TPA: PQQ-binding-like beta-propeller repeat protein [Gemmatimonadales bacterium]|nr:PQQ-binding-like beta-propeller repeat protein [Gemmatimonadales bacterium]
MTRRSRLLLAALLVGAGAAAFATQTSRRRPVSSRTVTDALLGSAGGAGEGWLTHGRDWSNQRYAPVAEIDHHTVPRLEKLWQHKLRLLPTGSGGRMESTPVVVDHLLIYTDADNSVIAVDTRTGREYWRYHPKLGPMALCCGVVNRGVAIYGDGVYLATTDARVVALDRRDGSVKWEVKAADPAKGYSFTMAPLAADGKIIVGASGGEFGIRGFVDAYDPGTGKRIWRFWTVPSPEEGGWYGRWSQTTPDGERLPRNIAQEKRDSARYVDAWSRGGASVWATPAYDPELGVLIVGTGNPSGVEGVLPPGDNLYSTSLIAIDIATGRMKWYYQMVPHNLWDYDASSPPVLFDVVAGDSTVPAVGQAGKTGWVYFLDRRTGKPIRRSDAFVPQKNVFPTPTRAGTLASPGDRGGNNWPPLAYSRATGLLYVLGSHVPMLFVLDPAQKEGEAFTNTVFKTIPGQETFGTVTAIDVNTGKIRWQRKTPRHLRYSGALATEGGLVFFGDAEGWLNALDAETGATLWRQQVDDAYLGPPITFLVDGHQRIAVTTERGLTVFGLPKKPLR